LKILDLKFESAAPSLMWLCTAMSEGFVW